MYFTIQKKSYQISTENVENDKQLIIVIKSINCYNNNKDNDNDILNDIFNYIYSVSSKFKNFSFRVEGSDSLKLLSRIINHRQDFFSSKKGVIKLTSYLWEKSTKNEKNIILLKYIFQHYSIPIDKVLKTLSITKDDLALYNFGLDPNIQHEAESSKKHIVELWNACTDKKKRKYFLSDEKYFLYILPFYIVKYYDIDSFLNKVFYTHNYNDLMLHAKSYYLRNYEAPYKSYISLPDQVKTWLKKNYVVRKNCIQLSFFQIFKRFDKKVELKVEKKNIFSEHLIVKRRLRKKGVIFA